MISQLNPVIENFNPDEKAVGIVPSLLHRAAVSAQGLSKKHLNEAFSEMGQGTKEESEIKR